QLFFKAMNIPCITVAEATPRKTKDAAEEGDDRRGGDKGDDKAECIAVLSRPPEDFRGLSEEERRTRVEATIKAAVEAVEAGRDAATVGFAHAARVPLSRLRETARDRWDLSAGTDAAKVAGAGWLTAADVLEMRQGVTPGGVLELFLMTEEQARRLGLEETLVHRAVKSKEVERWRLAWTGRAMFYPYHLQAGASTPAFTLDLSEIKDKELARLVRRAGLTDALDFDKLIDRREEEIARRKGVNQATVGELPQH